MELMDPGVLPLLKKSGLRTDILTDKVIPHLIKIGIRTIDDLEFLSSDDLDPIDELTVIEKRKLFKYVNHNLDEINISSEDDENSSDIVMSVNFIAYNTQNVMEESIPDITPSKDTLQDLMKKIKPLCIVGDDETVELYSKDGYPLHNNTITGAVKIRKWRLKDDFIFVLIREKDQPGQLPFATLPGLDHEIGEETFTIETPHHGTFPVNAYMDSDSPEDIAQKIYNLTDVPVPNMSLFVRRGYNHERLDPFTELQDGDIIRVVLRDPQEMIYPHSNHYGQRTYRPMIPQTDVGISKFYSILRFLCYPQSMTIDYDFEKLLSCLLDMSGFPPLVYSLRLLHEQSYLSIPGWVALVEGCHVLFKKLISCCELSVPENQVFELSDYLWSYLIEQSKSVVDPSDVEFEDVSLVCPLSGTRILTPVYIQGLAEGPLFDKDNVLEKIKRKEDFSNIGFDNVPDIQEKDLVIDNEVNSLLLYFPWEHIRKVYKWRNQLRVNRVKDIEEDIDCSVLSRSLPNLSIVNPGGLFAGKQCLTYIDEGRLVYFLGASKGDDEHRRIYDPISRGDDYQCLKKKNTLDMLGRSQLERCVTCDLSSFAKSSFSLISEQSRVDAIIKPHETTQWEPEEAIVVLLDYSGSMSNTAYPETGSLRCIDAAKELFNAFATRTQAYRLHHCFGLTIFSDYVIVKLRITKNSEEFEMSLRDLDTDGGTSLTDAMINGIQQLQQYSCIRRIICLTDGFNTSRTYSYDDVLIHAKINNVIIDTVLITGPHGNPEQMSLSHSTGGVCVLPLSMNEALRFFEMDTMLSVKERSSIIRSKHYRGYETEDHLLSETTKQLLKLKTMSAKRFSSSSKSKNTRIRILKEVKEILQNPHPGFKVFPSYESFNSWKVLMKGPPGTAYEEGVFVLGVIFPEKYPAVPPEIRFLTQIHHCNVSKSSGRICHAILGSGYTPATSMRDVLSHVYGLLMCPDIDTPLDSTLVHEYGYLSHRKSVHHSVPYTAFQYFNEAAGYFSNAEVYVQLHASSSFEDLEIELDDLIR